MSTFKGIVAEFPQIRIDYFRQHPDRKAPLACFLSHVHSDHLVGLESLRAPFVYCSAATREILLHLEKYHYRVNFARGILESRNVTYDRSMHRLAKALPLETPTTIELDPKNKIRVTLFDANHCVGAVMFLIEGDGNAILYTGDIRAETWWVNSLVQNPVLLPYTLGIRRLDCMYLDTTFAIKAEPYREFPSKAEGIRELLHQVKDYRDDTIFYFHSWTFGYENVWIALSAYLQSQIHLDDYRARIYASLSVLEKKYLHEAGLKVERDNKDLRNSGLEVREAAALCGFRYGNHTQEGCLTTQTSVRLHSCERGMGCPVVDQDTDAKVVHIIPIVTRVNGTEVAEIGAGGGKGDLDQKEELETGDVASVEKLMELCAKQIDDQELLSRVLALLQAALNDGKENLDLGNTFVKESQHSGDDLSLQTLVSVLSSQATKTEKEEKKNETIRFPYSRHSSYSELCELVNAFHPKDVFPCTIDEGSWNPTLGMRTLFGSLCSSDTFRHDAEMMELYETRLDRERRAKRSREGSPDESQTSEARSLGLTNTDTPLTKALKIVATPPTPDHDMPQEQVPETRRSSTTGDEVEATQFHTQVETARGQYTPVVEQYVDLTTPSPPDHMPETRPNPIPSAGPHNADLVPDSFSPPRPFTTIVQPFPQVPGPAAPAPSIVAARTPSTLNPRPNVRTPSSASSKRSKRTKPRMDNRAIAYKAALGVELTWADFGGLVSARRDEEAEVEL